MKHVAMIVSVLLVMAFLWVSCAPAPAPTPAVVKETVQVEVKVPVQQTVQQTVQVPVVVTATPQATPAPKKGGTLIAAYATDAKGIDPHKATNFSAFRVLELTYDSLLAFDKDLKVVPNLAESWKWSDDNLTLTMTLHNNVKFHSGNPLTSDDVKYSFERILDEKTGAAARSYFTSIDSIQTPDATTVVFKLKEPVVSILAAMTNPNSAIIDKKAVVAGADPAKDDVGSGAFKIASWQPDQKITLVANKDFWIPGQPYLDGVEIRTIPDESSILAALRAKQIDWAIITDARVAIAAGATGSSLYIDRQPNLNYHVMQLNANNPVFKDVRVRQAISCAIDRQQVLDTASFGEGQVVGPVTPPYYRPALSDQPCYTTDLDKAKQLLAQAGVSNSLKFSMMVTPDEMPATVSEAQNIQAQLKKIGVETTIDSVELGVFVDRWFKTDFDAVLTENGGNPDPDVMLYRYWDSAGNLNSVATYSSADLDKLLTQARTISDTGKRKAIYAEFSKQLVDAAPWIWLYVGYQYRAMQPYVMGTTQLANGSAMYLRQAWLNK
ncbi:MAG: ABC transporter substrate-binding protein [Chloroflexi bacterium]|nr:ABC transporter substrate-binding protein [Chloroflexota bacterium]